MGLIDALVSELFPDFIHSVVAADQKHLEIQFGGDSHDHVLVEVVVVGLERFGSSPSGLSAHHGSFNFEEFVSVQEVLDFLDDLGSLDENFSRSGIHDQIEVSLAVSSLFVLETGLLGGKHVETGRQQLDLRGLESQFSGFGSAWVSDTTDDVPSSETVVELVEIFGSLVDLVVSHNLDFEGGSLEVVEDEVVSLFTNICDTASNASAFLQKGSFFLNHSLILLDEFVNLELLVKFMGVTQIVVFSLKISNFSCSVFIIFGRVNDLLLLLLFFLLGLISFLF